MFIEELRVFFFGYFIFVYWWQNYVKQSIIMENGSDELFFRRGAKNEGVRENSQCIFGKVTVVCLQDLRTILDASGLCLDQFFRLCPNCKLYFHLHKRWKTTHKSVVYRQAMR